MTTRVVNKKYARFDVYVGRPGMLGSPIKIGRPCPICRRTHTSAGGTIPCFRIYFAWRVVTDLAYRLQVEACKDKWLGCHCKDRDGNGPCHGDIYAEYNDGVKL